MTRSRLGIGRAWIVGAVACALATGAPGAASSETLRAQAPQDVERLVQEGRLDEAIALARGLLDAAPQDPDRHMALAQALAAKGRKVHPVLEAHVALGPGGAAARAAPEQSRVEVVYDPHLLEEALEHVRQAIALAPQRADLRWSECYLLTDAGAIERAAAAIRRALAALPREAQLARTVASYGSERLRRGDSQGGAILLGIAAEAFPDDASVQVEYGSALVRDGKPAEASRALDRAGELAGADVLLHRKRGLLYLVAAEHARARAAFEKAFQTSRADADRLAAAAAAFAADPPAARWLFEELATPAASSDPRAVQLAEAFLRALEGSRASRLALAEQLRAWGQDLLALPVLDRTLADDPHDEGARGLADEIRRPFLRTEPG